MKRWEIHATTITTSWAGAVHTEHVQLEIEAMSLSVALQFARMTLTKPGVAVFVDKDLCREVSAA